MKQYKSLQQILVVVYVIVVAELLLSAVFYILKLTSNIISYSGELDYLK